MGEENGVDGDEVRLSSIVTALDGGRESRKISGGMYC